MALREEFIDARFGNSTFVAGLAATRSRLTVRATTAVRSGAPAYGKRHRRSRDGEPDSVDSAAGRDIVNTMSRITEIPQV
jgi:hypothetical protein